MFIGVGGIGIGREVGRGVVGDGVGGVVERGVVAVCGVGVFLIVGRGVVGVGIVGVGEVVDLATGRRASSGPPGWVWQRPGVWRLLVLSCHSIDLRGSLP